MVRQLASLFHEAFEIAASKARGVLGLLILVLGSLTGRVALRGRVSEVLVRGGYSIPRATGGRGGGDLGERGDDVVDPGPGVRQPQMYTSATMGEPGRDVQHPVAQQLRLRRRKIASEREKTKPGDQVGGDGGELDPDLVDLVFA